MEIRIRRLSLILCGQCHEIHGPAQNPANAAKALDKLCAFRRVAAHQPLLTAEQRAKSGTISFLLCSKACTAALGVVRVHDGFRELTKAARAAVRMKWTLRM